MDRRKHTEQIYKVDLRYPLNLDEIKMANGDCFGIEYDMTSTECPMCADNEVCAIVFMKKTLSKKVAEQQAKDDIIYLDECDLLSINQDELYDSISSGVTKVSTVIAYLKKEGRTSDDVAVIEWVKRFKRDRNLSIKGGVIWKP